MRRFFLLFFLSVSFAATVKLPIFAVTEDGEGVTAWLTVSCEQGSGIVSIAISDSVVGPETQESVLNAVEAASKLTGKEKNKYNFTVKIEAPATQISGSSAGLPIALAVYSLLSGKEIPKGVSGTGQISPSGDVLPVGKVFEKAKTAHNTGIHTFLIPKGERNVTHEVEEEVSPGVKRSVVRDIDLVEYAKKEWDMNVYEVSTLSEAVSIVFEKNVPKVDVNTESRKPIPEFNPPPVNVQYSGEFLRVADYFLGKLEEYLERGKECSNGKLKGMLRSAKSMYSTAKKMRDLNYYYTAANFAFLGLIDARKAVLVCEHPSIENVSSLAFQDLYEKVRAKADLLEKNMNDIRINRNNVEWVGAARDRFIRAESELQDVENGKSYSALSSVVVADEWLDAAEFFLNMSSEMNGDSIVNIEHLAKQEIIYLEDLLSSGQDIPPEAAERKLWARLAYEKGWYYTAATEAALAVGLIKGHAVSSKTNLSGVSERMKDKNVNTIWGELYLNHSLYYYYSSVYYKSKGAEEKAKEMANTALEIYFMAKEIDTITKSIFSAPVVKYVVREENRGDRLLLAYFLLACAFVFLLAVVFDLRFGGRKEHLNVRLAHLEKERRKLEKEIEEKKKRVATIKRLITRYRKKLNS